MDDVCFETNIMGCKWTLKDVRHVLDLRFNLMLGFPLDKQGYDTLISLYLSMKKQSFSRTHIHS